MQCGTHLVPDVPRRVPTEVPAIMHMACVARPATWKFTGRRIIGQPCEHTCNGL